MPRKKQETDEMKLIDLSMADKIEARVKAQLNDAGDLYSAALAYCVAGDPALGFGLLQDAQSEAEAAAKEVDDVASGALQSVLPLQLEAQSLCQSMEVAFSLFSPDLLLQVSDKEFKGIFTYTKGGTFKGRGSQKETSVAGREIHWRFYVDKNLKCKRYCLVSVFHFRGKDNKVVVPAKKGFTQTYLDNNSTPGDPKNTLPHGGKDKNGYAVDTPFFLPQNETLKIRCPCYTERYRIDDKGDRDDLALRHIGGMDAANAQKTGFVEYFETAVLCLDKQPYTVLNSMRWRTDGKKAVFLDGKGKPTKSGKVEELGDVSSAFKRALIDWIKLAKKTHKKEIKCSGLYS